MLRGNENTDRALFYAQVLGGILADRLELAKQYVRGIPAVTFERMSNDDVVKYVFSKLEILGLEVDYDSRTMDVTETMLRLDFGANSPGLYICVHVPFRGDEFLWDAKPSNLKSRFPKGSICQGELVLSFKSQQASDRDLIKRELENDLDDVKFYVGEQKRQLDEYHRSLEDIAAKSADDRRQELVRGAQMTSHLGIPLRRRKDVPDVTPVKISRTRVRELPSTPNLPTASQERGIEEKTYQHILSVIRHEGRTFETVSESLLGKLDEEDIRDIILAHLNGHYEGEATAEAFRKKGKTDIRIEDDNRAAFIAECKIWKGKSSF
ncbi:MAG: hypothetical protein KDJ29_21655, partial [Hyphomicrobiales bacterium]|nr:hypothetical protein [Hyphomicrobiales bacterium]